MPTYEYRCPNGHLFERFQRISDPAPEACDVCGASPVELVLYPVAIHYKGSGFYSTDYGKGKKRRDGGEPGEAKGDKADKPEKTEKKDAAPAEKKAAEA
jgi:putative FmdB family regulatory protein